MPTADSFDKYVGSVLDCHDADFNDVLDRDELKAMFESLMNGSTECARKPNNLDGSVLLTKDNVATLTQWFGGKDFNLRLLYRKSADTCDATLAKQKIYGQGPTLAVYKSTTGQIFGGYTSLSWAASPIGYKYDANAFMYSLAKNVKISPASSYNAVYFGESNYIIVWGDMRLYANCDVNFDRGDYTFPYYTDSELFGGTTVSTSEIEVFAVTFN